LETIEPSTPAAPGRKPFRRGISLLTKVIAAGILVMSVSSIATTVLIYRLVEREARRDLKVPAPPVVVGHFLPAVDDQDACPPVVPEKIMLPPPVAKPAKKPPGTVDPVEDDIYGCCCDRNDPLFTQPTKHKNY